MNGFFKLANGVSEHPKLSSITPEAFALWVGSIDYASRNRTDGFIPAGVLTRVSIVDDRSTAEAAPSLLVERALWHVVDGGWQIHDYLDWNTSSADIEKRRATDRERKARPRARSGAAENSERNPDGIRADSARKNKKKKNNYILSSESDLRAPVDNVDDDDQATAAASAIAERRLARSQQPIGNPNAWLAAVRLDVIAECIALADQGITAAEIADRIEPEPAPALTSRRTATERAEYRQRIDCDHCHGTGMRETDAGYVSCDHTGSTDSAPRPRLTLVETPTGT